MRIGFILLMALFIFCGSVMEAHAAKSVVIDAGHGGSDPGALGVTGLREKDVNLDISLRLQRLLQQKGYRVVMTRQDDTYLSLADRVKLADHAKADLFVSVHANSHPNSNVDGTLVLYYDHQYPQASYPASAAMAKLTPESKRLAELVLKEMLDQAGTTDRGLVPSAAYVIRMGSIPSILVETAFLSHRGDEAILKDADMRERFAVGIAKGIEAYLPLEAELQPDETEKPELPVGETEFPDLDNHWARDAALYLKERGIIEGIDNRYEPDRAITRAEWLTMADRLFDFTAMVEQLPEDNRAARIHKADLLESHWAYTTFGNAIRLGVINGYEDGSVKPDKPITRAEVAALWERMTGKPGSQAAWTGLATFTDVPPDYWASGPIYRLKRASILDGLGENQFAPAKFMTRAETAAMINRYMKASEM